MRGVGMQKMHKIQRLGLAREQGVCVHEVCHADAFRVFPVPEPRAKGGVEVAVHRQNTACDGWGEARVGPRLYVVCQR
jgi:hypothetical protein